MMSFIFICFYGVIWTTGAHANTIYLSPANVNVVENTSVTLTCSKTNGQLQESRWTNSQMGDQEANLYYINGQCITTRFLQNNNLFAGVCNSNGTFSVILKRIDRLQHGAKWQCKETLEASNTVTVNVAGVFPNATYLSPANVNVVENTSVTLTCSKTNGQLQESRWTNSQMGDQEANLYYINGQCMTTRFLLSNNLFAGVCNSNGTYSVILKRIDRLQHGAKWQCKETLEASNTVTVNVAVPLANVDVYQPNEVYLKENNQYTIKCGTSACRPQPTISWYLYSPSDLVKYNVTEHSTQTTVENKDGLVAAESLLLLVPNRSVNGWMLHCEAWTDNRNQGLASSQIALNISYPPDSPPIIHGHETGNIYRVIESDRGEFSCSVTGGNPLATLSWKCFNSESTNMIIVNTTVMLNVTWIAKRNTTICSCEAYHIFHGKQVTDITIDVLYPPDVPTVSVSIGKDDKITATDLINIIEKDTINLECFSKSRPAPRYTWSVDKSYISQENTLKLMQVSRKDAGNYTCHVNNLMNRTFGVAAVGNNSSSTLLNVLYSSDVGSLSNTSLKEASTLNITCPVKPGNPAITEVFWTRKRDSRQWNSSQLIILNVSRADDTVYTCTVSNKMIPTIGNVTKTTRNNEFHLNVFFSAVIKVFTVFGKNSKEAIVVNQREEVSFICTTEANPAADITIRSPQNEHIAMMSNSNTLSHTLIKTSCVNAGEYICTGRNNYTRGHASSSNLILIVRCPPRPSSDITHGGKIASTLHVDVTLQFTARNYLDGPDKTTFIWFKDSVSVENDDSKFVMSLHGLQSNLSIRNITENDFGRYGLLVSNSVGQYMHLYQLLAKDKPEAPEAFGYIEDSITDTSVTLKWMPGFNGGYSQSFLVVYKIITRQQWQNKTIIDTGDKEMNHTLFGLVGMTEYQVKMFARNKEGDSAYTESLQFTTLASASTAIESHSSSSLVIVAATVPTVVIVTIFGIIVVVLIYRKSLRQAHGRQTTRTVLTYEDLDANKRAGDMYSQLPATYEQLNNATQERSMYMEMEQVQIGRENPDYINTRI